MSFPEPANDNVAEEDISWRGCSMNEIYRGLGKWELRHFPDVYPSDDHAVLYHFPIRNPQEAPRPLRGHNKWDAFHVRLPSSSKSQYPVLKSDGTETIECRWELIQKALLQPIISSHELEAAILSYNSKYQNAWKFTALHKLFDEVFEEEEVSAFFTGLLPKIIRLALRLPELVSSAIPLLKQDQNRSVTLSQEQISCLLANAFLCTFPRRNTMKKKSEYSTFPDINFNRLFQSPGPQVLEKLKCIFHYFRRVLRTTPKGVVTFTRRSIAESRLPKWSECNAPLAVTPLHVTSAGTIEDQGKGLLQVDFANKFLGGGVLGSGCVQEEIRFVICPELIVSRLFTEALRPCEALVMSGCEQFSKYTGYSSSFTWSGDFIDATPLDESGRRECHIVAIDALQFFETSHQYHEVFMLRELNKAFVGFYHPLDTAAPGVASGNWGCGAFGGEATLKALLQLMVCTVTKRPLVYFTFGDRELRDAIHDMHTFFLENNITVRQLWSYLKKFETHELSPTDLYSFICQIHRDQQTTGRSIGLRSRPSPKKSLVQCVTDFCIGKKNGSQSQHMPDSSKETPATSLETATAPQPLENRNFPINFEQFDSESSIEEMLINAEASINVGKDAVKSTSIEAKSRLSSTLAATKPQTVTKEIAKSSSPRKVPSEKPELRQRTLLEMLDVFYKESPAKRHRNSSTAQND